MPGMGMGMGFGMRQDLTQRLEQKQAIRLTLSTLAGFSTSAEEDSIDQKELLEKFVKELKLNVYSSWEDFHDRCMKRIKKEDRSENVKELIKAIRDIIEKTKPNINEIRSLLNLGIYAAERNEIPKVILYHLADTLKTKAFESLEDKLELIRVGEVVQTNRGPITSVYEFLHKISEGEKFAPTFKQILSRVAQLGNERPENITFVNQYLEDILEEEPEINEAELSFGFEFVDQLYELTKERVERKYILDARKLLGRKDLSDLKEKTKNIPKPILANLVKTLSPELISKVNELFSQKYLKEKTDARRRVFRALYALDHNPEKKKVLEHLFTNVNSAEYVSRILAHLEILEMSDNFAYFFDETEGPKINRKLSNYALNTTLKVLELSDEYKEKVGENPHRLVGNNLLNMISTFGGVLSGSYREGLQLLREITEHIIDDDFEKWRYSHEKARKQLKCLGKADKDLIEDKVIAAWRRNETSQRLIGDLDKINPKLGSLKIVSEELKSQYQEATGIEATESKAKEFEKRIEEINALFKTNNIQDKNALAQEKRKLLTNLETLDVILAIEKSTPDRFEYLNQSIEKLITRTQYEEIKLTLGEAKKILDSPEIKGLERVTVVETDLPHKLFDIGKTPVQSCQRWNEPTGYNKCLLAYLADANKKLYQVLDHEGKVIVRSVVRLLPFDNESPVLLIERPYASRWTEDYGKALFSQVAQRALELSEALGEPVAVASNDERIIQIMNKFTDKYESDLESKSYQRKLPESKNEFEYSDSLGGCLPSGAKISRNINYVFIEKD